MKAELLDRSTSRLWSALGASILVNGLLWRAFGSAIMATQTPPPRTIEISRVILNKQGKRTPKIVTKKQIQKKVAHIHREIEKRKPSKPLPKPTLPPIERQVQPKVRPRVAQNVPQTPDSSKTPPKSQPKNTQGAHNRTMSTTKKAAPDAGFVKPGGHSDLGKPIDKQNYGEKQHTPKDFATPAPQAQPTNAPEPADTPVPPPVDPPPTPKPTIRPTPIPPTPIPPTPIPPTPIPPTPIPPTPIPPTPIPKPTARPAPTDKPKPRGETRDAIPVRQPKPDIPDELRGAEYKSSVRVNVAIDASGNSSASLRGTSGNAQIDALVLRALSRWKWKPALKDGVPVASSLRFKFDIEVN